jgi:hypothetical protein
MQAHITNTPTISLYMRKQQHNLLHKLFYFPQSDVYFIILSFSDQIILTFFINLSLKFKYQSGNLKRAKCYENLKCLSCQWNHMKSVTDTAVQSAVDTWEATLLDAPYSASWQWRLSNVFIWGTNWSSRKSCCKTHTHKEKKTHRKHWNKCVLFPNSDFNFTGTKYRIDVEKTCSTALINVLVTNYQQ